ncbi:protein of unknown function [Streptomyces sp. KY70]|nr:protein of unknown function [Streptomyces sp. KY70]
MAEGKRWRQRVVRGGVRRSAVRPVVRLPAAGDGPGAGAGRPTRSRLAPAAGPAPLTGGGAPHERLPGRPGGAAAADRTADRDGPFKPAPPTAVTGAYRCTWGAEGEGRRTGHGARWPGRRARRTWRAPGGTDGTRGPRPSAECSDLLSRKGFGAGLPADWSDGGIHSIELVPIIDQSFRPPATNGVRGASPYCSEQRRRTGGSPGWQGSGGGQPWWGAEWRD